MDLPGSLLLVSALVCYVLALQWGGISLPWSDSKVVGLLVGFGVLLIVYGFVQWVQKERAAMIGRLFRRNVIITMIYIDLLAGTFFLLVYYLPIYFQVVSGVSAAQSGIRNLPLILAQSVATVLSGVTLSKFGYPQPFLLFGAALTAISAGLLYTLEVNTGSGKWIGYQLLAGIGVGWCFQVPVVTAQASVKPEDLPSVTAMVLSTFLPFLYTILKVIANAFKLCKQSEDQSLSPPVNRPWSMFFSRFYVARHQPLMPPRLP